MDQQRRRPARRRVAALAALALTAPALGACTISGPYMDHGFPACFLQLGPGDAPNIGTPSTVYPILGDFLWEICFLAD